MKQKIVFEQAEVVSGTKYRVVRLTNRTDPKIGELLTKAQVDNFINGQNRNLTVEIVRDRQR